MEDDSVDIELEVSDDLKLTDFFYWNGQSLVPKYNIADMLPRTKLEMIGRYVKEGYEADEDSMKDWALQVKAGLELARQERSSRSEPWEGAANFKSPLLTDACLTFSDRASTELLRHEDLCKVKIVGKDLDGSKQERADRVNEFQNWQINVEMPEWREEQEKLIYDLPYHGTVFKKTYFDSQLGRLVSDLVSYPSFTVNNEVKSIEKLRRFSEKFEYPKNTVEEKFRSGLWIKQDLFYNDDSDEYERDGITHFIEQQTYCDLDNDGYEEPYTVVIHEMTGKVVRITPRFEPKQCIIHLDGVEGNLDNVMMGELQGIDMSGYEVLRIHPWVSITKYGFLPDPQGGFLDVGYSHLLCALVQGINTTTNQLLDAGTLANLIAGFLSKEHRTKQGEQSLRPGEFRTTGITAQALQNSIMLLPTKEPSVVLFQLLEKMNDEAKQLAASADLQDALGVNTPAATTLALIEDQQLSAGTIIRRVYESMSKEFDKMFKLNAKFTDPKVYMMVVDDPLADFAADFNPKDLNIVPSANPEVSSKIQRIQQASAELEHIDKVVAVGGNPRYIVENYYKAIGCTHLSEVFPEMTPEQELQDLLQRNPQLMDMIMGQKEQQDAIVAVQLDQIHAQNEALKAESIKLAADAEKTKTDSTRLVYETAKKLDQMHADVEQTRSKTILNLAQAEAVDAKNEIDDALARAEITKILTGVSNDQRRTDGVETQPNNTGSP